MHTFKISIRNPLCRTCEIKLLLGINQNFQSSNQIRNIQPTITTSLCSALGRQQVIWASIFRPNIFFNHSQIQQLFSSYSRKLIRFSDFKKIFLEICKSEILIKISLNRFIYPLKYVIRVPANLTKQNIELTY